MRIRSAHLRDGSFQKAQPDARQIGSYVSAHRQAHLRRCQALEVCVVRLRALCLVSAPACKQIQENLHGFIEELRSYRIRAEITSETGISPMQ